MKISQEEQDDINSVVDSMFRRSLGYPQVGHLTEVKHNDDGLCFVCMDIDCDKGRPIVSFSKPVVLSLWQMIGLACLGLSVGFVSAVVVALKYWG